MTYNFATAFSVTTIHKLKTQATEYFLVTSFQNCELKQEFRTLATALNQPHTFHNRERRYFFSSAGLGWNCSEIETSRRIFVLTPQLVLTSNFATGKFVCTSHTLRTLTTAIQLVSSFQNCELKQEPRTLATELHQPHNFHNRERRYFFLICRAGLELFRDRNFATNFCFNSKPSFSFDSIGQRINYLLPLHLVANHIRIGLESKLPRCDS